MNTRFYYCQHCKNLVIMVHDSKIPINCCGEKMIELVANTTEAATEKHIPVVSAYENMITVTVGSVEHPMLPEHFIEWICLVTDNGSHIKYLKVPGSPKASFSLTEDDKPLEVYAYCNLHGLWKTKC